MNRATFLTALVGGAFALPNLAATTPDKESLYDALDAVIKAQFAYDFPQLTSLLHPLSLRLFRNMLTARFDQLLHYFPVENILRVSGLPEHPKGAKLTDAEVFVTACNAAKERHPGFVGDPKLLPLSIRGAIFEPQQIAHVLFSYSTRVQTEHAGFDDVQPSVYSFRKVGNDWLLYSGILSRRLIENWWLDLSKPKDAKQN